MPGFHSGSSPRVRGDRIRGASGDRRPGLIPACAGRPSTPCRRIERCGAHPRVCGATTDLEQAGHDLWGSSPRVRGDRPSVNVHFPAPGLIPACAGRPFRIHRADNPGKAHPRVCGATDVRDQLKMAVEGSSPRVRGDPLPVNTGSGSEGLIPACAGRPPPPARSVAGRRAHPRVCGATRLPRPDRQHRQGSSPRVRGDRRPVSRNGFLVGLIPACAGRPLRVNHRSWPAWAHPRVCGATFAGEEDSDPGRGSSPRVRGDRLLRDLDRAQPGLIPACAGRPPHWTKRRSTTGAHPRVCGATEVYEADQAIGTGSSPRVRGDQLGQRVDGDLEGLIPACAGRPGTRA